MRRYSSFIKSEIDLINRCAAWTDDQATMFELLVTDRFTADGIMERMRISKARYQRLKGEIEGKIMKIMSENNP